MAMVHNTTHWQPKRWLNWIFNFQTPGWRQGGGAKLEKNFGTKIFFCFFLRFRPLRIILSKKFFLPYRTPKNLEIFSPLAKPYNVLCTSDFRDRIAIEIFQAQLPIALNTTHWQPKRWINWIFNFQTPGLVAGGGGAKLKKNFGSKFFFTYFCFLCQSESFWAKKVFTPPDQKKLRIFFTFGHLTIANVFIAFWYGKKSSKWSNLDDHGSQYNSMAMKKMNKLKF